MHHGLSSLFGACGTYVQRCARTEKKRKIPGKSTAIYSCTTSHIGIAHRQYAQHRICESTNNTLSSVFDFAPSTSYLQTSHTIYNCRLRRRLMVCTLTRHKRYCFQWGWTHHTSGFPDRRALCPPPPPPIPTPPQPTPLTTHHTHRQQHTRPHPKMQPTTLTPPDLPRMQILSSMATAVYIIANGGGCPRGEGGPHVSLLTTEATRPPCCRRPLRELGRQRGGRSSGCVCDERSRAVWRSDVPIASLCSDVPPCPTT